MPDISIPSLQVEEWLEKVDYDHDGTVSFEEFKYSIQGNIVDCQDEDTSH